MAAAFLTAVALFLPVRSLQQLAYVASLGLALLVMYTWGRIAARRLLDVDDVGPATAAYLGQWVLLAALEVATTANAALAVAIGWAIPLVPLVLVPSCVLLMGLARQTWRARGDPLRRLPRPLSLLALGSLAVVTAIYSRHLSALGLDTHQHVAWVRQILNGGFVPLVEPTTTVLADYPRTFHLLTAIWSAAGLGLPPGPFVKVMPFLQSGLAAVAASELLARAVATPGRSRFRWELVLGIAGYVYAFLLVPTTRPAPDLSGTPRLASLGLLLLPVLLLLVATAHRSATAARWSLVAFPLVGAWALTSNPMLLFLVVAASAPMAVFTWAGLGSSRPQLGRWSWREVAAPLAIAVLVAAHDPWLVSQVAQRSRTVGAFLERRGLSTYRAAVSAGLASDRDKVFRDRTTAPPCRTAGCVIGTARTVARDVIASGAEALRRGGRELVALAREPSTKRTETALARSLPIQPSNVSPHAALPLAVLLLVALGGALWSGATRRSRSPALAPRLFLCWMAGVVVSGFAVQLAAGMARALGDQSHDAILLAGYLSDSGYVLFVGWFWIAFLLAAMVLYDLFARERPAPGEAPEIDRGAQPRPVTRGAVLALSLALPSMAILNVDGARRNPAFLSNVSLSDLRALRRVESAIPAEDAVIVPAEHWNIGDWEHWVIPVSDAAALLPYGDRRYLFNVYLGPSYVLSWHDLEERLCGASQERRRRFLAEHRARWLLLHDEQARSPAEAVARARICEKPALGLLPDLQPVRVDGGLYLFRIGDVVTPGSSRAASP